LRSSNTFLEIGFRRRLLFKWAIAGLCAVSFAVSAFAIDPARMLSQYLHDSWGTDRGLPSGSISAIAQTSDGYLWIGTDKGLVRFDGLSFRQFEQANPDPFVIGPVRTLLVDTNGDLWILLQNTKLFRFRDGKFELSRGETENGITAMARGKSGAVLLSSLAVGTLTYRDNQFRTLSSVALLADAANAAHRETADQRSTPFSWSYGNMPDRLAAPTSLVVSIAETADGKIWLGTQDGGLFYLQEGRVSAASSTLGKVRVNCLLPVDKSDLWVGTAQGMLRWNGTELTSAAVPSPLRNVEVLSMLRDQDANLWVGTSRGLFRYNANGVSLLSAGESGGAVTALFEDREGNIWIGGARGLERLRDSAFVSYSVPNVKSQSMGPVYVDPDGRTWVAPIEGGLRWGKGAQRGSVSADGIAGDTVYSLAGSGSNDLWVGRQHGGLTHVRSGGGSFTARTYTQADGLAENRVFAVYVSRDGTVWSGTLGRGVSALREGRFSTYTSADGLASNTVSSIAESADGTMWFGTPNGLSELGKRGWRTYTSRDGLPSSDVNCLMRDSSGGLWIGTSTGLAYLSGEHLMHVAGKGPEALHESILGMVEDGNGELWVATTAHVLEVKRSGLLGDELQEADYRDYGPADGLQGTEGVKRHRSVVADSRGQIWFSTNRGLAMVNPARAQVNSAPALVHIEEVAADGKPFNLREAIEVPAGKQRTTIRYTGLSLGNAERVRYRYQLDGLDQGWSEAVSEREATYGNLGAGSYRFHVMASNSDGQWNGSEATVAFAVLPTLWETGWFRLGCVVCAGLVTLLVYRLRMYQLTRLLNVRFEERLAERTRIAQELHDTFLQGVVSVSMQLHVAVDQLPENSPVRGNLNRILQLTGRVIEEGRNTLRGLRSSIENAHDLKDAFSSIPQELGREQNADFRVVVEGVSLPLRPSIRDDVYGIGREALVNAFRHAGARKIDMHLEYAASQLRISVQDDGCGIDPQFLQFGRDGHWGLSGMRERADRIGGKLRVLTRSGGGTEVELRLPSDIAFESESSGGILKLFRILRLRSKTN